MRKDKKIKEIVEGISDISDQGVVLDEFLKNEEKELGDFVRSLNQIKNSIKPETDLALKILNKLPVKKKEDLSFKKAFLVSSFWDELKIQMKSPMLLKIAVPMAMVGLVAFIVYADPFATETAKISELKSISSDERAINSVAMDVGSYIKSEKNTSAVDSALKDVQTLGVSSDLNNIDYFDMNAIGNEATNNANVNLASYFAQEKTINQVDQTLSTIK